MQKQFGRNRNFLRLVIVSLTLMLFACGGADDDSVTSTAETAETDSLSAVESENQGSLDGSTPQAVEGEQEDAEPTLASRIDDIAANAPTFNTTVPEAVAAVDTEGSAGEGDESAGADGTGQASANSGAAAPSSPAQPVSISAPPCGSLNEPVSRTAPLTGLQASIPSAMPAVVVKVSNNSSSSRAALIGLDQADIVFEQRIEDSATRFFSVFHSQLPENVGPVRSGRTTDIELAQNLRNPIFGYSGSNNGVANQLRFAADNGLMTLYRNNDSSPFARDSRFRAPDNLFVSPAGLGACGSGNPNPIFTYGGANSGTARPASSVSFSARSSFRFDWNGSTWTRSQSGWTHSTRDGVALAPANVVVLFVDYTASQVDAQSVDASSVGGGAAWTFRNGTVTEGSWVRTQAKDPYTLLDGNGSAINLAPGQTWVVLAPEGTVSVG